MAALSDRITQFFKRQEPMAASAPMPGAGAEEAAQPSAPDRPQRAVRRHFDSRFVGGIDAGRVDRLAASWPGIAATPDEHIRLWWRITVVRSRSAAMNDPYMQRFVRAVRSNVVGHGPKLRCAVKKTDGSDHKDLNQAVIESWIEWGEAENCDVAGQESFLSLSLAIVSSLAVDGEAFIKITNGGPYGLQLQHLDSMRCPADYDLDQMPGGNYIRSGIEFDPADRPVAYYFSVNDNHGNYYTFDGRNFLRVAADEIIHIYRKGAAGQKRGLPWATPSLFRLWKLKSFEENAAMNAEVAAAKMGIISYDADAGPEADEDTEISFTAEPGKFIELPSGAHLDKWDPSFPDTAFSPFTKAMLRGSASGLGICYTTLANDLAEVNFSSIRAGLLEERELWKEDQKLFIEKFIMPVYRRWVKAALLRGMVVGDAGKTVPLSMLRAIIRKSKFMPRRWAWVDPKSDTMANQKAIDSMIKSHQEIIRETGRDPEEVLDDFAEWHASCREKGIPVDMVQAASGENVNATVSDNSDSNEEKEDE